MSPKPQAPSPNTQPVDWPAVHAEALDLFVRFLQIPSVNPPGDEAPAARFLGALIEAEGIPVEYIETAPNREVAVARLRGDGSKGALMLCNHTDVVPVELPFWTKPPFAGVIEDGVVYGRGAVDMKGAGVMQLITFLLLARQGTPLARDIVFCAVPDEEAGATWGMKWLCEHRPDIVDVEYEINEGGMGISEFNGQPARIMPVATAEKTIGWLTLRSVGKPGHGSRPHRDNSLVHLCRALIRLADWERPLITTPLTREYIRRLAQAGHIPAVEKGTILTDAQVEAILPTLTAESAQLQAMFINTLNITMANAGIKVNVIPAQSEAHVDCRLLPGQDREEWRQQVIAQIDDPRIEVTWHEHADEAESAEVPWDTELFAVIQEVMHEAMEDAVVLPMMTVGGTDNRYLRDRGIPAYGFVPVLLSPAEAAGFHGNDEHMTIDNLNLGCELTYEVVRRFCTK